MIWVLISLYLFGSWYFYRLKRNWYDLSFIGLSLIFFYGLSGYMISAESGRSILGYKISMNSLNTGFLIVVISMLISLIEFKKIFKVSRPLVSFSFEVVLLFWCVLLLTNFSEFNFSGLSSYGERVLEYNIMKRGESTSGFFEVYRIARISSLFLYGYLVRDYIKGNLKFGLFLPEVLILVHLLLQGDRALLVHFSILFVFLNVRNLEIGLFKGLIASIFGFILFSTIGIVRATSDPVEMIGVLGSYISKNGLKFLAFGSHGELGAGANLFELVQRLSEGESMLYGKNLFSSVLTFLPRFVYRTSDAIFGNERFAREFYFTDWLDGKGHGYFIAMDGYWDAKLFGVVFLLIMWKFILGQFVLKQTFISKLWYSMALSGLVLFAVRSGFYASLKQWLIYSVFLLLYELKLVLFFRKDKIS